MTNQSMVDAEHAVEVLNRMLSEDREAVEALMNYRVPCNKALGDDPTIQVGLRPGADKDDHENGYQVGLLGIINGIFGVRGNGSGWIAGNFNVDGTITHFLLLDT